MPLLGRIRQAGENAARLAALAMVLTAVHNDAEFAAEFRTRFLGPRLAVAAQIYRRAAERGELRPGADPSLLGPALAGILLHRSFLLDEEITPELVERVLDQIILPAATGRFTTHPEENP